MVDSEFRSSKVGAQMVVITKTVLLYSNYNQILMQMNFAIKPLWTLISDSTVFHPPWALFPFLPNITLLQLHNCRPSFNPQSINHVLNWYFIPLWKSWGNGTGMFHVSPPYRRELIKREKILFNSFPFQANSGLCPPGWGRTGVGPPISRWFVFVAELINEREQFSAWPTAVKQCLVNWNSFN